MFQSESLTLVCFVLCFSSRWPFGDNALGFQARQAHLLLWNMTTEMSKENERIEMDLVCKSLAHKSSVWSFILGLLSCLWLSDSSSLKFLNEMCCCFHISHVLYVLFLQASGTAKPYGSSRSIVRRIATSLPLQPCPRVHFQVRAEKGDRYLWSVVSCSLWTWTLDILYFKIVAYGDFKFFEFVTILSLCPSLLSVGVTVMWQQITLPLLLFTFACLTVFISEP